MIIDIDNSKRRPETASERRKRRERERLAREAAKASPEIPMYVAAPSNPEPARREQKRGMIRAAKGGTIGGGVVNSGGERRSMGQYLGDLTDYLGADLYQGATGQLFDPYWKRTEVATNQAAEKSNKLNSYEYSKMSEMEISRKLSNDKIYKDNVERVAKGQPQLPYFQFSATPEWKTFYDTKTGKMDFEHTPLFSTLNEFDRASADLLVIQSKARELLVASGTPVNPQTMDNATRNFMADPKYYKEAGYSPYQISQAQNAYYTSKLGLPVPGKGAPWYQRAQMALAYESAYPSPQLMEAEMHKMGLSSWSDIRGNSDNPLDIIAGYVGGTAGFIINLAMTGGVGGVVKGLGYGGKALKASKLAPLALPFTASDEMFAGLSRGLMKTTPKFTPELASTLFATPVRQGVGMGAMSAGLTAAEGGDAKEVLASAGAGAITGAALGWFAPKAIAKLSGGAMGKTDGDFIQKLRYPVVKSSFDSLIQSGKEILHPLDKSGALVNESAYLDFVENADSAIQMLTKYGENKILNGIADKNVGVTPLQWMSQLRQRVADGDPAAKESIVKIAKDLQHPDFMANFESYYAPEGEMFQAQQAQEAFVNKLRKEKGMTLGELSAEITKRNEGNEAYYAMERYAKDNGLTVQELKAKMNNGQYPSLPVINAMAQDLGISKQDARRLMYVAPDVSPREQEWMRVLAQIRPLEGGKIPFAATQAEYETSLAQAAKRGATNSYGESKRNLAILAPSKDRVVKAYGALQEAQADYQQTLAARKTMGGMRLAQPEQMGDNLYQRIEDAGAGKPSFNKPQGIYTSPLSADSPHSELGGSKSYWERNKLANVLGLVDDGLDKGVVMRSGASGAGAGVHAAKKLLGENEFNYLKSLSKSQLISAARKMFPDVQWERYYDKQEIMEAIGGINDLSPVTGIKPGATLQDMKSPWDFIKQVNTDFSQFNYTGRPFVEAMTDIGRLAGGAPRKQTELKALIMRLKADPKNALLSTDFYADLLRNPSIGGTITYGGQVAKILSSFDRIGGEKNEFGENVMRDNDFDPSRQGVVADLDPMEEIMMLMLGNAPEVSEYYNLQKNKLSVDVLTKSVRSDLQQKYVDGLAERMLGINTGKWKIYTDAVMDATSKEPNNPQDLTTNEYTDLTQKSIENYEQDPAVLIRAINVALRALPQKSKRRAELEKLLLDYQKLEAAEEEKAQKGSEINLRRAKGMGL